MPKKLPQSLRLRCHEMLLDLRSEDWDEALSCLIAFVIAERGRAADTRLDKTLPVCLYFANDKDRNDFIELAMEANPNLKMSKVP